MRTSYATSNLNAQLTLPGARRKFIGSTTGQAQGHVTSFPVQSTVSQCLRGSSFILCGPLGSALLAASALVSADSGRGEKANVAHVQNDMCLRNFHRNYVQTN